MALRPLSGPRRALVVCAVVGMLIVAVAVLGVMFGAVRLTLPEILSALTGGPQSFIVGQYRLPRVAVSVLAGAAFGLAGVFLQGALRNPLASPDVVGVTKWAGLGAFSAGLMTPPAWAVWATWA